MGMSGCGVEKIWGRWAMHCMYWSDLTVLIVGVQLGFELKDVSGFDGFKFTCQPSLLKGLSVGRSRRDTLPETEEEEGDLSVRATILHACQPSLSCLFCSMNHSSCSIIYLCLSVLLS